MSEQQTDYRGTNGEANCGVHALLNSTHKRGELNISAHISMSRTLYTMKSVSYNGTDAILFYAYEIPGGAKFIETVVGRAQRREDNESVCFV